MSDAMYHYLDAAGNQQGPVPADDLANFARAGTVTPQTLVWTEGWEDWQPASAVEGLSFAPPSAGPAAPSAPAAPPPAASAPRTPWGIPAMTPKFYSPGSFKAMTWLYAILGVIGGLLASAGMVVLFASMAASRNGDPEEEALIAMLVLVALGALFGIGGAVFSCILMYRWWRQIQDGHAETGPGKAVGFLFIPLFSYYWIFVAYWGLAKDLDAYTQREGIGAPSAWPKFALATVITSVVIMLLGSCVGVLALPFYLAIMVMWLIMYFRFSKISAIIAEHQGVRASPVY